MFHDDIIFNCLKSPLSTAFSNVKGLRLYLVYNFHTERLKRLEYNLCFEITKYIIKNKKIKLVNNIIYKS